MSDLPEPPAAGGGLAFELETTAPGTRLVRVHDRDLDELQFNSSPRPIARFRPIGTPVVPTLYAGVDEDVAIAEGLFHDVPIRPGAVRQYPLAGLDGRVISELAPTRELTLVQLHGYGLQRLGLTHGELIETPAAAYEWTARWAHALHVAAAQADGLVWMSRRFTGRAALMLWQQTARVQPGDLTVIAPARPLWEGPGRELVLESAARAAIRLIA
ncbi:MAG TPA: RES family NAD+ phosphorylase [Solirubrobacteraceae bacterium]|nr:RES family NAD+ phosphorylase [Solirubrobacteraceae bacterium]